ncbi:LysR family transcriptional regulator [Thioclava sp. BHET1]|nr:LysR family transcriptional regulator [Thioclava sp. BHET1]
MRFKGLDLNLLVVLDRLLTEQNVSRAADKLCLSQSATSGALARLRDYFGDELLVQVGRKLVPTPRALALSGKVRAALLQIDGSIIQAPGFDPATACRTVRIVASDYVTIVALSDVVMALRKSAPDLSISITPPGERARERLERGEFDLLVLPDGRISPDHPSTDYFADEFVVIAWSGNTRLGDTLSESAFFDQRHAASFFPTSLPSLEASILQSRGRERKIVATAGGFAALPFLVVGTELIALIPRRLAECFATQMPLRILPSPVATPPLVERLQWHTFSEGDECLAWLRQEMVWLQRNAQPAVR